ncbi:Type IV secretion system protein virB9 [Oligella sp. MSHR50489EDL]|uniref:TrbG/VirB9 family P-type conjugative transfer protein n=1 Tax=Oligella TaxID=90243 RepID=UPI000D01091A|nr:TrbG/VirB9 family P-type conjugative transfer protein [Oligella urethralis]AVL70623.1 conjugal transfer protein [Oligella urethralis]
MKKNLLSLSLIVGLSFFSATANALVIPSASKKDPAIQTVTYTTDNVISVRAAIGRVTLIQFEDDEHLDGDASALGMGDVEAWNIAAKGNNILFKPMAENPDTNLIVITNKRTYVFKLTIANKGQSPTYVLRFRYPDTEASKRAVVQEKREQAYKLIYGIHDRRDVAITNDQFYGFGHKELKPTAMYDDGRFTYLEYQNGRELPVVYKRMPDGTESLINMHVKDHTIVVHETAKDFVLRHGDYVLGIENRGFNAEGKFNYTGTTQMHSARIIKKAE